VQQPGVSVHARDTVAAADLDVALVRASLVIETPPRLVWG
jgi:hypothetical protein